jgi:hypothetical protein
MNQVATVAINAAVEPIRDGRPEPTLVADETCGDRGKDQDGFESFRNTRMPLLNATDVLLRPCVVTSGTPPLARKIQRTTAATTKAPIRRTAVTAGRYGFAASVGSVV